MKLQINNKNKPEKHRKTGRLNNMLLNNEWVNNKIKKEIKRYLETNENENKTTQNLCNTTNAVPKGKFKALEAYLKKQEQFQINT